MEHFFTSGACTNPSDRNLAFFLDESDVVLGICRETLEGGHLSDVFCPSWQIHVDGCAPSKFIDVGGHGSVEFLTIEFVVSCDLQGVNAGKHVKFGQVDRAEAINLVGIIDNIKVEPAALSATTSCGSPFVAD